MDSTPHLPLTEANVRRLSPPSTEPTHVIITPEQQEQDLEQAQRTLIWYFRLLSLCGSRGSTFLQTLAIYLDGDTLRWRGAPALQHNLNDAEVLHQVVRHSHGVIKGVQPGLAPPLEPRLPMLNPFRPSSEQDKHARQQRQGNMRFELTASWVENINALACSDDEDASPTPSMAEIRLQWQRSNQSTTTRVSRSGIQRTTVRRSARVEAQAGPRRSVRIRNQAATRETGRR